MREASYGCSATQAVPEKPAGGSERKPTAGKAAVEKPVAKKPVPEEAEAEKPTPESVVSPRGAVPDKASPKKPTADKPAPEKVPVKKPVADTPAPGKASADKVVSVKAPAAKPATEKAEPEKAKRTPIPTPAPKAVAVKPAAAEKPAVADKPAAGKAAAKPAAAAEKPAAEKAAEASVSKAAPRATAAVKEEPAVKEERRVKERPVVAAAGAQPAAAAAAKPTGVAKPAEAAAAAAPAPKKSHTPIVYNAPKKEADTVKDAGRRGDERRAAAEDAPPRAAREARGDQRDELRPGGREARDEGRAPTRESREPRYEKRPTGRDARDEDRAPSREPRKTQEESRPAGRESHDETRAPKREPRDEARLPGRLENRLSDPRQTDRARGELPVTLAGRIGPRASTGGDRESPRDGGGRDEHAKRGRHGDREGAAGNPRDAPAADGDVRDRGRREAVSPEQPDSGGHGEDLVKVEAEHRHRHRRDEDGEGHEKEKKEKKDRKEKKVRILISSGLFSWGCGLKGGSCVKWSLLHVLLACCQIKDQNKFTRSTTGVSFLVAWYDWLRACCNTGCDSNCTPHYRSDRSKTQRIYYIFRTRKRRRRRRPRRARGARRRGTGSGLITIPRCLTAPPRARHSLRLRQETPMPRCPSRGRRESMRSASTATVSLTSCLENYAAFGSLLFLWKFSHFLSSTIMGQTMHYPAIASVRGCGSFHWASVSREVAGFVLGVFYSRWDLPKRFWGP